MKNYFAHLLVFAVLSFACASCSEEDDDLCTYNREGKYVLPFKVKIVEEEDLSTRLIFNGASQQGGGAGKARNLLWTEDDELAFTATNFPADKKVMPYKMHVEDELLAIYGDEPLPLAASTSYTLQSVYPFKRVIGYNSTTLEAELPTVQNGTVNRVHSSSPKDILCPEGQETSEFDAVNITDYTSCLLYASAYVTTDASKNLTSNATLTYRVRVRGFDVIIDAPKQGSATINEVDIEVGTYADGVFKPHTSEFFTGTIADISSSAGSLKNDSKRSTKIQLKFAPTTISGTDRIVARLYAVRKNIPSGLFLKITTKCSAINDDAAKAKTLYQIVKMNQPVDNSISHFYMGQIPSQEDYVDLGLSVHWATKNIGAASSTDAGSYFAWAADKSVAPFSFATYMTFPTRSTEAKLGETKSGLPAYNNPASVGSHDIKGSTYDIAHLELGGKWHMPNQEQWNELVNDCTWTWDAVNQGYTVTGPNGNSIFIPAAGYMDSSSQTDATSAYYWSSTREESTLNDKKSYAFCATSSTKDCNGLFVRHLGMLIRPVRDK